MEELRVVNENARCNERALRVLIHLLVFGLDAAPREWRASGASAKPIRDVQDRRHSAPEEGMLAPQDLCQAGVYLHLRTRSIPV